eukprot:gnl/TRDRNA2_/TRDRNA2_200486_c0_seq1.p1 gnl/TRDRNA2_/TRDRNA2_200486_c0~~gnl/TRDRNA2_/TRDRNA2_200486_c0_seq1.p1  ORF type:complete len:285 (-),score=45.67 gnl/TRDRNA2_/TRDRNA2_200486_c0_seq1:27-785(-)
MLDGGEMAPADGCIGLPGQAEEDILSAAGSRCDPLELAGENGADDLSPEIAAEYGEASAFSPDSSLSLFEASSMMNNDEDEESHIEDSQLPCSVTQAEAPHIEPAIAANATETPEQYLANVGFYPGAPKGPLQVTIDTHMEVKARTMYILSCQFLGVVGPWYCSKRLCDLRADLHDQVKVALGPVYQMCFADTPFAHRGGVPGTTARLNAWFRTLDRMMNRGELEVQLCVLVLRFLETPRCANNKLGCPEPR